MIIKSCFPSKNLQRFKNWEEMWKNVVTIRKRPTDYVFPDRESAERCNNEPFLFTEIEIHDLTVKLGKWPIYPRLMIDMLFDLSGFFKIDDSHDNSVSFSFEKDIEPAFQEALGKDWLQSLTKIERKIGFRLDTTHKFLPSLIPTLEAISSNKDCTEKKVLGEARKIITDLLHQVNYICQKIPDMP